MISAVIPTRNRAGSLGRTLRALACQQRRPDEVIVVDASDTPLQEAELRRAHELPVTVLHAAPGVCAQRNLGVRRASGAYVLLCDDDIEPPCLYVHALAQYLDAHPDASAASGIVCEPGQPHGFESTSLRHLLFAFVFQLSVAADVDGVGPGALTRPLARWYRERGNTWSAAGWPLITQVRGPVVRTAVYGLGAALVRRECLLAHPFDERLGPHGIGDNYGVALHLPGELPIALLTDLAVVHHRVAENRLSVAESFLQRVLALDYFQQTRVRLPHTSRAWLAWSLVGKTMIAARARDGALLRAATRALSLVVRGRNPLLIAAPARTPAASAAAARQ